MKLKFAKYDASALGQEMAKHFEMAAIHQAVTFKRMIAKDIVFTLGALKQPMKAKSI